MKAVRISLRLILSLSTGSSQSHASTDRGASTDRDACNAMRQFTDGNSTFDARVNALATLDVQNIHDEQLRRRFAAVKSAAAAVHSSRKGSDEYQQASLKLTNAGYGLVGLCEQRKK